MNKQINFKSISSKLIKLIKIPSKNLILINKESIISILINIIITTSNKPYLEIIFFKINV